MADSCSVWVNVKCAEINLGWFPLSELLSSHHISTHFVGCATGCGRMIERTSNVFWGKIFQFSSKALWGEKVTILVDSIGDYVQLLSFHEIIFSYVELIYMCNCAMVQHGVYSSSNWLLLMWAFWWRWYSSCLVGFEFYAGRGCVCHHRILSLRTFE